MPNLDMSWEPGEVGDFYLTVGKRKQVGHVYQTPWTGQLWTAHAPAFGIDQMVVETASRAKIAVEMAIADFIDDALYCEQPVEDLIWTTDLGDTII